MTSMLQLPAITWEYVVLAGAIVIGVVKLVEVLFNFVAALVGRPMHDCDGDVMELERIADAVEELRDEVVAMRHDGGFELERIREAVEHIRDAGDKLAEQLDERLTWSTDTLCDASREQTRDLLEGEPEYLDRRDRIREHLDAVAPWSTEPPRLLTREELDELYPAPYSRQWWRQGFAGIFDGLLGVFRGLRRYGH